MPALVPPGQLTAAIALTTPAVSAVSGGLAFAALIGLLFPAFARYRSQSG